jgi:outer membrane protein
MKRTIFLLSVTVAAFLATVGSLSAQTKIGIVDVEKIIQQMPEMKGVEAKLKAMKGAYEDTLRAIQANFQAKLESYQKQQGMLSPEAKQKEEGDLQNLRDQFLQYQQDRLGQGGALVQMQETLIQPIRERVKGAIDRVAKDEKLQAVFDKAMLAYSDPKLEITFKVLDYLNRGTN